MTWVKICGISDAQALDAALEEGADALGFVFAPESRRRIGIRLACELAQGAAGRALRVGVLTDPTEEELQKILKTVPLDALQWSGRRYPQWRYRLPERLRHIRAVPLAPGQAWPLDLPDAWAYLADAGFPGSYGGTGNVADWEAAASGAKDNRVILAGGLSPDRVDEAILQVKPFGVDVSSGVESGGKKDPVKIREFLKAVRQLDLQRA